VILIHYHSFSAATFVCYYAVAAVLLTDRAKASRRNEAEHQRPPMNASIHVPAVPELAGRQPFEHVQWRLRPSA